MDRWRCNTCGRTVGEKPKRNVRCGADGCAGKFYMERQCGCGKWFRAEKDSKYCSIDCPSRSKKVTLTCDGCGEKFTRRESELARNPKNVFCSAECRRTFFAADRVERVCETCGKEFSVYKSALEGSNASGRFCCRACYDEYQKTLTGKDNAKYQRVTAYCKNCGEPMEVIPSKLMRGRGVFCSRECFKQYFHIYMDGEKNPNWTGGYRKHRGDFEYVKRRHFSKVQVCALCGTPRNIHIHHLVPYRLTHDNKLDNLIPLCASHHKKVETITKPIYEGFDDKELAKSCLNALLRPKQRTAQMVVAKIIADRKAGEYAN